MAEVTFSGLATLVEEEMWTVAKDMLECIVLFTSFRSDEEQSDQLITALLSAEVVVSLEESYLTANVVHAVPVKQSERLQNLTAKFMVISTQMGDLRRLARSRNRFRCV